jgi:hypothetical protein
MDPLYNGVCFGKHLLQFAVIEPFFSLVIDIFFTFPNTHPSWCPLWVWSMYASLWVGQVTHIFCNRCTIVQRVHLRNYNSLFQFHYFFNLMNISPIFETQNIISTHFVTSYEKMKAELLSLKLNSFLSWYSWKIAELALNNNHSLTSLRHQLFPSMKLMEIVVVYHDKKELSFNEMMIMFTLY